MFDYYIVCLKCIRKRLLWPGFLAHQMLLTGVALAAIHLPRHVIDEVVESFECCVGGLFLHGA